jgi:tRNA threonylcarbamoyl adenosine modification protein YjeE
VITSEDETKSIAEEFAKGLNDGDVIILNGELGAGKTYFVKKAISSFAITWVNSPSFAIVNEYKNSHKFYHIDFYRIKSVQELFDIMPSGGSTYLYSHSDPVDEEGTFGDNRRKNWLAHFGINEVKAHASGHATYAEAMNAVGSIGAKDILTVHTIDRTDMKTGLLASGIMVSVKQAY